MDPGWAFFGGVAFGFVSMLLLVVVNIQFLWVHHRFVLDNHLCGTCDWCKATQKNDY